MFKCCHLLLCICPRQDIKSQLELIKTLEHLNNLLQKNAVSRIAIYILANDIESKLDLANYALFIIKMLLFRVFSNIMVHILCLLFILLLQLALDGNKFAVATALKIVSATFLLVCFLSLNDSTCQNRKNYFYFT